VHIDAISLNSAGDLQLSFDISVTLPGVGAVDDEDVVVWAGGMFAMVFDGSAAGVASSLAGDTAGLREAEISRRSIPPIRDVRAGVALTAAAVMLAILRKRN
jgi:hypothetical protein